jgi:hypothetical protein
MTSLLILPRVSSSLVWSDDQLKSKIRPDVNLVNCFGSPPASGCSQMFVAPSRVRRYCSPLEALTKPCFYSPQSSVPAHIARRVLRCVLDESSSASRRFVVSSLTHAALCAA